jgi:hypothetical protein
VLDTEQRTARWIHNRLTVRREEHTSLFASEFTRFCHPERSEGSAFCGGLRIPRSARDDHP